MVPRLGIQWRLDPVPAGKNLYTIRNVGSGTHAGFEGDAAVVRWLLVYMSCNPCLLDFVRAPSLQVTASTPSSSLSLWMIASVPSCQLH